MENKEPTKEERLERLEKDFSGHNRESLLWCLEKYRIKSNPNYFKQFSE